MYLISALPVCTHIFVLTCEHLQMRKGWKSLLCPIWNREGVLLCILLWKTRRRMVTQKRDPGSKDTQDTRSSNEIQGKKLFPVRVVQHWEGAQRGYWISVLGVIQSLTKQGPEQNQSNLEDGSAENRRLDEQTSRDPLQPELFCDSLRKEGGVLATSTLH